MKVTEFKTNLSTCNFVFKDGTLAIFINYVYHTTKEDEIEQLKFEVKRGNQYIFGGNEVDVDEDPLAGVKQRAIQEYLAKQKTLDAEAINPKNVIGGSKEANLAFGAKHSDSGEASEELIVPSKPHNKMMSPDMLKVKSDK